MSVLFVATIMLLFSARCNHSCILPCSICLWFCFRIYIFSYFRTWNELECPIVCFQLMRVCDILKILAEAEW